MRRNLSRGLGINEVGAGRPYGDNGPVRYVILGTAQAIRDDGTPVAVGGARLRALLTALALRPGRVVPAHLLVDEVWDGDRPADAAAALQALVARLRRALGHEAVRSADGGYRLAAEREDVDLYRFERLARAGESALAAGIRPRPPPCTTRPSPCGAGPRSRTCPTRPGRPSAGRPYGPTRAAAGSRRPSPWGGPSRPCPS